MKNKNFDAVKMMRKIREELSKKYSKNPELEKRDMKKIREKYCINEKSAEYKTDKR